ncbi:hypothetical protein BDR22DRAFT_847439 [Usnea florida]
MNYLVLFYSLLFSSHPSDGWCSMPDLFKCDAHLRPIDEEAELGSVSGVVAQVDVITYFGNPRGNKEHDIDVEFSLPQTMKNNR